VFQPSRIKETLRFSPRTVLPPQRDSEPAKRSGAGAMYAVRFSRNFRDCVKKSLEKERKGVHDADIQQWVNGGRARVRSLLVVALYEHDLYGKHMTSR
jgi:hypothetical protein